MKVSCIPKSGRKGSVVYVSIWIRTCQHIDGWTDVPNVAHDRVLAPAALRSLRRPPQGCV